MKDIPLIFVEKIIREAKTEAKRLGMTVGEVDTLIEIESLKREEWPWLFKVSLSNESSSPRSIQMKFIQCSMSDVKKIDFITD
jgi:hypothetical protein